MERIELRADKRSVLGKKVRFLRREGVIPVNLFGHGIDSVALQCDAAQLRSVMVKAGQTQLISLQVGDQRKGTNVMIKGVQRNPLTGDMIHVDLYQVRMGERIKVDVPVVLVGEAPAAKMKGGLLTHEVNTISVEALPDKIPAHIEADVSSLVAPDQVLHVSDLKVGEGVIILEEPDTVVARVSVTQAEEAAAPPAAAAAPGAGESESAE